MSLARQIRRRPRTVLLFAVVLGVIGSSAVIASAAPAPVDTSPRFNQLWSVASHNSYYFGLPGAEPFGAGPSQHLLDDLYIDRMRSIEFDLHKDEDNPDPLNPQGRWNVHHTDNSHGTYTLCTFLSQCLNILRAYHFANPNHDPITIRLESKSTGPILDGTNELFSARMTPAYLDGTLTRYLHDGPAGQATTPTNDWVFGPKDYYQWCQNTRLPQLVAAGTLPAGTTLDGDNLTDAVRKCGWPTLNELRGKFIVNLFGSDPILQLTSNSGSVDFYSHGEGRTISQMKIFPEAIVNEGGFLHECGEGGVCNWGNHTVFAEVQNLDPNAHACKNPPGYQAFPCFVNPDNGDPLSDPGRVLRDFIAAGGIIKSGDADSRADKAAALSPFDLGPQTEPFLGGRSPHGYNYVGGGDSPRNMLVNYTPANVAKSDYLDGVPNWSYGCLWDQTGKFLPGCNGPLPELGNDIFIRTTGAPGGQLSDHTGLSQTAANPSANDQLVFLNLPRSTTDIASLKAFVSTRKGRMADQQDDYGPTYTGNMGCLMARADTTDARAPFFAVCRYGHRNGGTDFGLPVSNEGLYVVTRMTRGGPVSASYSSANPTANVGPSGNRAGITHQGQWELQPFLRIAPDQAGKCWTGFSRSTDDPSPAQGFGEVAAGPTLCYAEPLNFVGLATDGGREEGLVGEYTFANVKYDGRMVTADPSKAVHLTTTLIGNPPGTPLVQSRSYFGPLNIQAPSRTITYGDPIPTDLAPTYVGLISGDTGPATPPRCSAAAQASSDVGSYPITCSAAVDPYYTVAYGPPGQLTITPRQTALTASSLARTQFHPTARLVRGDNGAPVAGQTVVFMVGTARVCSAVSGADGTAVCASALPLVTAGGSSLGGFTATFAGSTNYQGSSAHGAFL